MVYAYGRDHCVAVHPWSDDWVVVGIESEWNISVQFRPARRVCSSLVAGIEDEGNIFVQFRSTQPSMAENILENNPIAEKLCELSEVA